tara:strand:+ start:841 stop:1011 length:171 start_codon:yes stop_codon:yes gene_type:complete
MLRFIAGLASGWVAARSLPPKPQDVSAISLPSAEEMSVLAQYVKEMYQKLQEKLQD